MKEEMDDLMTLCLFCYVCDQLCSYAESQQREEDDTHECLAHIRPPRASKML